MTFATIKCNDGDIFWIDCEAVRWVRYVHNETEGHDSYYHIRFHDDRNMEFFLSRTDKESMDSFIRILTEGFYVNDDEPWADPIERATDV